MTSEVEVEDSKFLVVKANNDVDASVFEVTSDVVGVCVVDKFVDNGMELVSKTVLVARPKVIEVERTNSDVVAGTRETKDVDVAERVSSIVTADETDSLDVVKTVVNVGLVSLLETDDVESNCESAVEELMVVECTEEVQGDPSVEEAVVIDDVADPVADTIWKTLLPTELAVPVALVADLDRLEVLDGRWLAEGKPFV